MEDQATAQSEFEDIESDLAAELIDDEREAVIEQPPAGGVPVPRAPTALARLDPQRLLMAAVRARADIETLERLVALGERVQAQEARQAFRRALAEFQRQCPEITRNKWNDFLKVRYASLGHLIRATRPFLAPLGLTVTFETEVLDSPRRASTWTIVAHELGHEERKGPVVIPVDTHVVLNDRGAVKGATEAQRVGIAIQYSRRYGYLNGLGINAEDDTDGVTGSSERQGRQAPPEATGATDGPISEEQVRRFWGVARAHVWDQEEVRLLLTSRGIASTKEVPRSLYEVLIDTLKSKPRPV